MKLLIVDDSLIIRNEINRTLLSRFDRVSRAENGRQAIDIVRSEQPNVVTMDLTMPQVDGVEAIKEIMRIAPETYILVISALADKATAIEALTLGANGFLCKPFCGHELSAAIERILEIELSA